MWIVGFANFDQSMCGIRQWTKYAPLEWTVVLIHQGLTPELLGQVGDAGKGKHVRLIDVPSLQQRLDQTRAKRSLLYRTSELGILRKKILTWTLVEYDRIFSVDTDIFVTRSPFDWINPSILKYTDDSDNIAGTVACEKFFNGGILFFKPDMEVAKRLVAIKDHSHYPKACEPLHSDQSLLNYAFPPTRWRTVKSLVYHTHYRNYKSTHGAAVVHFTGRTKPFDWMTSCSQNRTAMLLGPAVRTGRI